MGILTISRKVGSHGDEIAAMVAANLGWRLVSRQDVHTMAQECDVEFKKACQMFENEQPGGFFERFFLRDPSYISLFESMNYQLAAEGNVVILGRGAQIVLQDMPGVFKVRVVAPAHTRITRVAERLGLNQDQAADYVDRHDRQRRSWIEMVWGKNLSDWSLYDLIINTENISRELAAELVCHSIKEMGEPKAADEIKAQFTRLAFAKGVESSIRRRLALPPHSQIVVEVPTEGKVVLTGHVDNIRNREKAEKAAAEHHGVTSVENKLKVMPIGI